MRFYMFYKWQQSGHEVIEIFSTLQALQHDEMGGSLGFPDPDAPWCWYIYLHDWVIFGVNVGIHIPAPWVAYGRIASTSGTSLMIFFSPWFPKSYWKFTGELPWTSPQFCFRSHPVVVDSQWVANGSRSSGGADPVRPDSSEQLHPTHRHLAEQPAGWGSFYGGFNGGFTTFYN